MCLAIPGKIITINNHDHLIKTAMVDFDGITKEVNLTYVPEAEPGDYVIVHVGFAISKLDEEAAKLTFSYLKEME